MITITHVINPFRTADDRLPTDQAFTFEALLRAKAESSQRVHVTLLSCQFSEDREIVPNDVDKSDDLRRSIRDLPAFKESRKLPLIGEILDLAARASSSDYFIYSNIDICPYPHFYNFIADNLEAGFDGLAINRSDIDIEVTSLGKACPAALEKLYSLPRLAHPGIDCVVFRREALAKMQFHGVCIGVPPVGQALFDNVQANSRKFAWYRRGRYTFHIGQDNGIWMTNAEKETPLRDYNFEQYAKISLFERPPFVRFRPKLFVMLDKLLPQLLRRALRKIERSISPKRIVLYNNRL